MAKTRCLSCLQMFEGETCPHCGYPASSRNDSHHLPVGTLLRGRYQLGQVLGQGGRLSVEVSGWRDIRMPAYMPPGSG